jgi:hypothetical protein
MKKAPRVHKPAGLFSSGLSAAAFPETGPRRFFVNSAVDRFPPGGIYCTSINDHKEGDVWN